MQESAKHWHSKIWRQRINIQRCNAYSVCYAHKHKKDFSRFKRTMVLTLCKSLSQVRVREKAESHYQEERKSAEYIQKKHLMKVMISQGFSVSEKNS